MKNIEGQARAIMAGLCLLCTVSVANATIIYDVNRTIGTGSVTGFIETDGTLGALSTANIVDWAFTLTAPLLPGSPDMISLGDSGFHVVDVSGMPLSATSTELIFDFSPGMGFAIFRRTGSNGVCWVQTSATCFGDQTEVIGLALFGSGVVTAQLTTGGPTAIISGMILCVSRFARMPDVYGWYFFQRK